MNLSQDHLNAFYAVSRIKSFTKAAMELGLTQSALSHRVKNLEQQLETSLFIRDSAGIRLTEAGVRLLDFCKVQAQLEVELIGDLKNPNSHTQRGFLRIGGASTVLWSVVVPALAKFLNQNPEITVEMMERELSELPNLLQSGAVDFIVTCGIVDKPSFEGHNLGEEINVLVEPKAASQRVDVYLDHHSDDTTTLNYLKHQGIRKPKISRSYMDNITGIFAGVEAGLGKAVLPKHLLGRHRAIEIAAGQKETKSPVNLYYLRQPFYSKLHQSVVANLVRNAARFLEV